LLSPAIDLTTHIQDVVGVLEYEDLTEVVLVGHSYGGMIISGVAEQAANRLAHLVYLDAFVPNDDQSALDLLMPNIRDSRLELVRSQGDGWLLPVSAPASDGSIYGVKDPVDLEWVCVRLKPHPFKTWQQTAQLKTNAVRHLPRTFIYCSDKIPARTMMAEKIQAEGGWRYREIYTGHDAMVTAPHELATLLLECVGNK
jgi:pimeloyl-ACP methyl ester carboxylesterase